MERQPVTTVACNAPEFLLLFAHCNFRARSEFVLARLLRGLLSPCAVSDSCRPSSFLTAADGVLSATFASSIPGGPLVLRLFCPDEPFRNESCVDPVFGRLTSSIQLMFSFHHVTKCLLNPYANLSATLGTVSKLQLLYRPLYFSGETLIDNLAIPGTGF